VETPPIAAIAPGGSSLQGDAFWDCAKGHSLSSFVRVCDARLCSEKQAALDVGVEVHVRGWTCSGSGPGSGPKFRTKARRMALPLPSVNRVAWAN